MQKHHPVLRGNGAKEGSAAVRILAKAMLFSLVIIPGISGIAYAQEPLRSYVFPKDSARSKSLASTQRSLVDTLTGNLTKLEIHESTLAPGKASHAPHRHGHEEVIILNAGDVDVLQGTVTRKAHAGDVIFLASNEWHNFTNNGKVDAKYLVIRIDPHDTPKDLPSTPYP